ncbi:MAG: two-component sensor histidine kinase [Rhizobiaceae bacterium]|nr:two-component sensor histidine kinase [Rhizobiaceae bacterium]
MASSDFDSAPPGGLWAALSSVRASWNRFWRRMSFYLPKRLYARSLLIVVMPMILLQSVVAYVYMDRYWRAVTERLSAATARELAAIVDLVEAEPAGSDYKDIIAIANRRLEYNVYVLPHEPLPAPGGVPFFDVLNETLHNEIAQRISLPFWIDTVGNSRTVEMRVQFPDKVLQVFAPRKQAAPSNTHIFLVWMVGTSLVLLFIAITFLRNQIRPIIALTEAAESFGRGRPAPPDFRPRGAEEVRRAGLAFIQMRERIERQMEQRTAMLSGVSHDLRTILTRFRLQLALVGSKSDREALNQDIDAMQSMLEGYLQFARGEAEEEESSIFDLETYRDRIEEEAELHGRKLEFSLKGDPLVKVRPQAFNRLLANLVGNAFRYAKSVRMDVEHRPAMLIITIDDDGPGIPPEQREEVFKPFVRLEGGRNLDSSGTGLGLAIARDVARSHGGDIVLTDSPLGGLRVIVRVPA